jgi:hypothetical protein
MTNEIKTTKVITGKCVLSYANVWVPKAASDGATPKYSASIIIPKTDKVTIQKIKNAIKTAYDEGQYILKGNGKSIPALDLLKTPLRDGDAERPDDEAYKNAYFVNANAINAPGIVDRDRQPILDHSEVYSGIIAICSISFYCYNQNGNKGIACGLNNIMKVSDGTPLGSRSTPEDDFKDITIDDDDSFLD